LHQSFVHGGAKEDNDHDLNTGQGRVGSSRRSRSEGQGQGRVGSSSSPRRSERPDRRGEGNNGGVENVGGDEDLNVGQSRKSHLREGPGEDNGGVQNEDHGKDINEGQSRHHNKGFFVPPGGDHVNLKSSRTNGLGLFRRDGPRALRQKGQGAAAKKKAKPQYMASDEAGQAVCWSLPRKTHCRTSKRSFSFSLPEEGEGQGQEQVEANAEGEDRGQEQVGNVRAAEANSEANAEGESQG